MSSGGLRRTAKRWLPPAVVDTVAGTSRYAIRFTAGFASWDAACAAADGYDDEAILESVVAATRAVASGSAAFERDGVTFDALEYRWPVVAALLLSAARNDGRLRVLDFGGSLGSTFMQYRSLLSGVDVRWGVVEQPGFVTAGQGFADDTLSFHESVAACVRTVEPRIAVISSVLQYLPDPHAVLREILASGVDLVVIDRTPMTDLDEDRAAVQVNPGHVYTADYPVWLLSRPRLTDLPPDWAVVDEFPGIEPASTASDGTEVRWCGLLLQRQPVR